MPNGSQAFALTTVAIIVVKSTVASNFTYRINHLQRERKPLIALIENVRFQNSRPPKPRIYSCRIAALGETVTLDDWRAIVATAVEQAKTGAAIGRVVEPEVLGDGRLIDLAATELVGDVQQKNTTYSALVFWRRKPSGLRRRFLTAWQPS